MIAYAESSAVLRWLFNEPAGEEILDHLRGARKVVCSRLTRATIPPPANAGGSVSSNSARTHSTPTPFGPKHLWPEKA